MFNHTLVKVALGDINPPKHMRLFKDFMRERGFRISTPEDDLDAVMLGGISLRLDEDFHVSILDHYDCVAPAHRSPEAADMPQLPEGFMAEYDELAAANEFLSPLGFAARLDRW
jgi:hypothetical protein